MRMSAVLGCLLLVVSAMPARAELPDFVLDRDYKNCMGNDNNPKHAAYCACVRDGMKDWSEDTYAEMAMQTISALSGSKAQKAPAKLEDLAHKCISQTLETGR
jgi:hypothetical protein